MYCSDNAVNRSSVYRSFNQKFLSRGWERSQYSVWKKEETLKLLLPKSNNASSEGSKESLKSLTITAISKRRSLEVDKTYFGTQIVEYDAARSRAREWELHVYSKFSKGDQHSLMGILAYLENIERGFGRYTNEKVYASVRKDDISGQFYEEASRGFEFSKQYIALAPLVSNLKARRLIK
jgi:hypothetical protein